LFGTWFFLTHRRVDKFYDIRGGDYSCCQLIGSILVVVFRGEGVRVEKLPDN